MIIGTITREQENITTVVFEDETETLASAREKLTLRAKEFDLGDTSPVQIAASMAGLGDLQHG